MSREVDITATLEGVDFAPASEAAEIIQNVKTILSTRRYDVPLDREFGLSADLVDQPLPRVKAKLTTEIISAIRKYEPRAAVTRVTFSAEGMDGVLKPQVRIKINA